MPRELTALGPGLYVLMAGPSEAHDFNEVRDSYDLTAGEIVGVQVPARGEHFAIWR